MTRATRKQLDEIAESVAANVRAEAPASDWVANINMEIDIRHIDEPWSAATKIAAVLGMDWPTLVRQANEQDPQPR